MKEKPRPVREQIPAAGGLDSIFDGSPADQTLVTVSSGLYGEQLPVANLTVGEIRARFRDRLDIDPRSQAVLSGTDVDDRTVVRAGQVLTFVRRAGEKGHSSLSSYA